MSPPIQTAPGSPVAPATTPAPPAPASTPHRSSNTDTMEYALARHPFLRTILGQVLATAIVSALGGGVGMWVGFQLISQRVAAIESKNLEQDARMAKTEDLATRVASDVAYIRGRLEPKP